MRRNFLGGLIGWLAVLYLPAADSTRKVDPLTTGPEKLEKWKCTPRTPVRALEDFSPLDPKVSILLSAVENNRDIEFLYHGGSTPGASRRVSPGLVFQAEGFPGFYFSGYCHARSAERVFRMELITLSRTPHFPHNRPTP